MNSDSSAVGGGNRSIRSTSLNPRSTLLWHLPISSRNGAKTSVASSMALVVLRTSMIWRTGTNVNDRQRGCSQREDGMKRLASRLTWWHRLPHKSIPRSTPQKGEASHGPYWHRCPQEGKPDLPPRRGR